MAAFNRVLLAGCFAAAVGCNGPDSGQPPVTLVMSLQYPPLVSRVLPPDTLGGVETLRALVKSPAGIPAPGVEVFWYSGSYPSPLNPEIDTTDVNGIATTRWTLRPLLGLQAVQAFVDGANGSPLQFQISVFPPKQPPPPQ